MKASTITGFWLVIAMAFALAACSSTSSSGHYSRYPTGNGTSKYVNQVAHHAPATRPASADYTNAGFRPWVAEEPQYRLLPGDQLDIIVYSAPELSRLLVVGPDGRVQMPLAEPVMAANLTIAQLKEKLRIALSSQLINPEIDITPRTFGTQQIFVGGEVGQPGVFTMPGRIGALEAVTMAGGFKNTAKTREVILIRRHPNGGPMMRKINLKTLLHKGAPTDNIPLQRGDVIYVPRSRIANIGLFMQQYIRDALPVSFSLSYYFGGGGLSPGITGP